MRNSFEILLSRSRRYRVLGIGLAVGMAGLSTNDAVAETFTATAQVSSALAVTEVQALDFGNLVIITGTTGSTVEGDLSPSGVWTDQGADDGSIVQIGTPVAAQFSVDAGVAQFVQVQLTFAEFNTGFDLTNSTAPPGNDPLTVQDLTVPTTLPAGTFAGSTAAKLACDTNLATGGSGVCQFLTSGAGVLTVNFGATIKGVGGGTHADGTYTGDFNIDAGFW